MEVKSYTWKQKVAANEEEELQKLLAFCEVKGRGKKKERKGKLWRDYRLWTPGYQWERNSVLSETQRPYERSLSS